MRLAASKSPIRLGALIVPGLFIGKNVGVDSAELTLVLEPAADWDTLIGSGSETELSFRLAGLGQKQCDSSSFFQSCRGNADLNLSNYDKITFSFQADPNVGEILLDSSVEDIIEEVKVEFFANAPLEMCAGSTLQEIGGNEFLPTLVGSNTDNLAKMYDPDSSSLTMGICNSLVGEYSCFVRAEVVFGDWLGDTPAIGSVSEISISVDYDPKKVIAAPVEYSYGFGWDYLFESGPRVLGFAGYGEKFGRQTITSSPVATTVDQAPAPTAAPKQTDAELILVLEPAADWDTLIDSGSTTELSFRLGELGQQQCDNTSSYRRNCKGIAELSLRDYSKITFLFRADPNVGELLLDSSIEEYIKEVKVEFFANAPLEMCAGSTLQEIGGHEFSPTLVGSDTENLAKMYDPDSSSLTMGICKGSLTSDYSCFIKAEVVFGDWLSDIPAIGSVSEISISMDYDSNKVVAEPVEYSYGFGWDYIFDTGPSVSGFAGFGEKFGEQLTTVASSNAPTPSPMSSTVVQSHSAAPSIAAGAGAAASSNEVPIPVSAPGTEDSIPSSDGASQHTVQLVVTAMLGAIVTLVLSL